MKRAFALALVALTLMPALGRAQSKPNFSGTWILDEAASDPAPAGRGGRGGGRGAGRGGGQNGPVVITQTATDITIGPITYKLDGTESTVVGGRGREAKATATWEGERLVTNTTTDARGMAVTTKEIRSLSADGKVMTVEATLTGPRGGGASRKTVFNKQ